MLYFSTKGTSTEGRTPQLPAVGAATIHFIQALDSATLIAVAITFPINSPLTQFGIYFSILPPFLPDKPEGETRLGS